MDAVARLADNLVTGHSYKVRLQAAALLAGTRDARALAALGRAAEADPEPLVRSFVVELLAKNPGGDPGGVQARAVLLRARSDESMLVRRRATAALAALDSLTASGGHRAVSLRRGPGPMAVAVGNMGDRTGLATAAFRARMRVAVISQLQREPNVRVADVSDQGLAYVVDGTIRKLELASGRDDVETTCAVELVISQPPRGLVLVASGEATVQKPKAQFRAQQRPLLEAEALEHAVKSAHENLSRFLANQ